MIRLMDGHYRVATFFMLHRLLMGNIIIPCINSNSDNQQGLWIANGAFCGNIIDAIIKECIEFHFPGHLCHAYGYIIKRYPKLQHVLLNPWKGSPIALINAYFDVLY